MYLVTTTGEVLNAKTFRHLKHSVKNGYHYVSLKKDGKFSLVAVHRIVCEAFHGPHPDGMDVVDHINCNPGDNRPSNLRWLDRKENVRRAFRKAVVARADNGSVLIFPGIPEAGDLGFDTNAIRHTLANDKGCRSQGFTWSYIGQDELDVLANSQLVSNGLSR